ncbi:hypothetical protein HMPREF9412_2427 [Paenibacillus sp. HGF5]|nr:hypothetical protein HMPREF9412_2427 [Paenibacillus sp. HGF5]
MMIKPSFKFGEILTLSDKKAGRPPKGSSLGGLLHDEFLKF